MSGMNKTEKLPTRLHHLAFVVRDLAKVRRFMEDVLGFPLVATWAEQKWFADLNEEHEYCHAFFGLDDGGALAFFQFADPGMVDRCHPRVPAEIDRFNHIAIRVDRLRYEDLKSRLTRSESAVREVDHGYCSSLYTKLNDGGLILEFTLDPPNVEEILADRRAHAREDLERWLRGDHTPNNEVRPAEVDSYA